MVVGSCPAVFQRLNLKLNQNQVFVFYSKHSSQKCSDLKQFSFFLVLLKQGGHLCLNQIKCNPSFGKKKIISKNALSKCYSSCRLYSTKCYKIFHILNLCGKPNLISFRVLHILLCWFFSLRKLFVSKVLHRSCNDKT